MGSRGERWVVAGGTRVGPTLMERGSEGRVAGGVTGGVVDPAGLAAVSGSEAGTAVEE
jgi:hypothetical protein